MLYSNINTYNNNNMQANFIISYKIITYLINYLWNRSAFEATKEYFHPKKIII